MASIAARSPACTATNTCKAQVRAANNTPHAWASGRQRRGGGSGSGVAAVRCQAKAQGDVGRVLRDALNQPAQGTNLSYLSAFNFLRGLGIENQADLNRVLDVAMNPNSLFTSSNRKQPTNPHARKLDVEEDLKPLLAYLLAAGMSQGHVTKLILAHPSVLSYRVAERLTPFFEYLTGELELSQAAAIDVVERRPTLLGVDVANLRRMVGFLLESGKSKEEVVELMATTL